MTPRQPGTAYGVRIWKIYKYIGARKTTYIVKWSVAGARFQRTFATLKLAESFRSDLSVAAREGLAFDTISGLPRSMEQAPAPSWLEHAVQFVGVKWPGASPRHRKGIAEALTDVTLAIMSQEDGVPERSSLRLALYTWIFNITAREQPPPDDLFAAVDWLERTSPLLSELDSAAALRAVLDRLALRQDGLPAAASTFARKRATLHSALEYAVELERLPSNPLKRVRWKSQQAPVTVDRRVVVNTDQARLLLAAVWEQDPAVAAFFACLYFAGLRPAEARALRLKDCTLSEEGWGELLLSGSHQTSGAAWTDSGSAHEKRGLKHRHRLDTRAVPAHPELVATLQRHIQTFQLGVDGMLFVSRTGPYGHPISPPFANAVSMGTIYRAWQRARERALTTSQVDSLLARRPYDLRHACLSTWLNAGVPAARVAQWAGHSVEVLLRVYAKCVDGDDEVAMRRIEDALRNHS